MVITADQLRALGTSPSHLHIKQLLVDFYKIEVVGLTVSKGGVFSKNRTVSFGDVSVSDKQVIGIPEQDSGETTVLKDQQRVGDISEHPVYTEKKRYLGKIVTFKLDTDTGKITALWVKPPLALRDLWRQILLIGRSQIVKITPEAVIVDEAVIKSALKPATNAELMREPEASLGSATTIELDSSGE